MVNVPSLHTGGTIKRKQIVIAPALGHWNTCGRLYSN